MHSWFNKVFGRMPIIGLLLLFIVPLNQHLHLAQHDFAVEEIQCSVCQTSVSIEPTAATSKIIAVLFLIFIVATVTIPLTETANTLRRAIRAPPYSQ